MLSHILVPVELDGDAVRLMFDTGAATLRVGVDGNPGALGGNLHGLLGLEAFANEAIVVDGASDRLYVASPK